jgi:hypothetical protein
MPKAVDIDERAEYKIGAKNAVRCAHGCRIGYYSAGY